jgi:hypothetical protein
MVQFRSRHALAAEEVRSPERSSLTSVIAASCAMAAMQGGTSEMGNAVKIGFVRKAVLFVISVAMVGAGLLMFVFDLLEPMPRGGKLFIVGGAMLAFLYLSWEYFIAPLFRGR